MNSSSSSISRPPEAAPPWYAHITASDPDFYLPTASPPLEHRIALEAAGVDPAAAVPIGEGWFAVAYRAGDTVVRILKPRTADAGWSGRYATEVELLQLLAGRGLPVPQEARAVLGHDRQLLATAHRYIDGVATSDVRLRTSARARLARELAAFLTSLHAIPLAEAQATGVRELDLAADLYTPLVEDALPLLRPRSRAWLRGRLDSFIDGGGSSGAPRALLHGDLGPPHILIDAAGSIHGIIDFADALIGDPAFDFAALGHDYSWAFVDRVLAHYDGAARNDPDLMRRAGFYVDVAPLYALTFGVRMADSQLLALGRRQIAARAAASTKAMR